MGARGKRWTVIGAAVAVALIAVAAVLWLVVRPQINSAEACGRVVALNEARDDSRPVSTGSRTAIVYGDSYAQGWGLDTPRASWPAAFGADADLTVTVDAVGSSGLLRAAMCPDTGIVKRIQDAAPVEADLVVIQTGLNDAWSSDEEIRAALARIDLLVEGDVALVGPTNPPGMADMDIARVDRVLSSAADDLGWSYIPLFELGAVTYLPDAVHPDGPSQALIGEFVASALAGR